MSDLSGCFGHDTEQRAVFDPSSARSNNILSIGMGDFWNIESIMVGVHRVPCTMKAEVQGLGHALDSNLGEDDLPEVSTWRSK